jgi:hypothetical protein
MSADSSIPRERFLDLMGPPNFLLSIPGNPGCFRNMSAVHAVQGDPSSFLGHWMPSSTGAGVSLEWTGRRSSSCIVCIPNFVRADGSVSCIDHTELLARVRGFRLTITSKAIN